VVQAEEEDDDADVDVAVSTVHRIMYVSKSFK